MHMRVQFDLRHSVLEGVTVCTFFFCRIHLMSADTDLIQCAVIYSACMVYAVVNGTLDAFIFVLSCHCFHHLFLRWY